MADSMVLNGVDFPLYNRSAKKANLLRELYARVAYLLDEADSNADVVSRAGCTGLSQEGKWLDGFMRCISTSISLYPLSLEWPSIFQENENRKWSFGSGYTFVYEVFQCTWQRNNSVTEYFFI